MGIAMMDNGNTNAAIDSYKQAIRFKPNYAEAYNNMANALVIPPKISGVQK